MPERLHRVRALVALTTLVIGAVNIATGVIWLGIAFVVVGLAWGRLAMGPQQRLRSRTGRPADVAADDLQR
jgi:hypothetical protein